MKNKKTLKRIMSVALSGALFISLASCSNKNTVYGGLDQDAKYLTSGDYSVTKGDIWNELQWSASSELESQSEVVVLNRYISKIEAAIKNNYDGLSDSEKALFGEKEYDVFYNTCNQRLVDYVVQDIYNFAYDTEDYWDEFKELEDDDLQTLVLGYIDEMFMNYRYKLNYDEIVNASNEKNYSFFLKIAKDLSEVYYVKYAKELFAEGKISDDAIKADAEDTDSEDNKIGSFTRSEYVTQFKKHYLADYNINLVLLRFSNTDEYNETLRAFGIKVSNNKLYFVGTNIDTGSMTYNEYCDYYDDLSTTQVRKAPAISENYSKAILGIYIEMYNYIYGGYRQSLPTALPKTDGFISSASEVTELNDLRKLTSYILDNFSDEEYDATIELLKANDATIYSSKELEDISATFKSYAYDTLDLNGVNYSTSSQSANSSYYIAYKFAEDEHDESFKDYTDDEIIDYITKDENKEMYNTLRYYLIRSNITSTKLDSYVSDEVKTCKYKIYNEAIEITYLSGHTDYSKTFGKGPNSNVLATITYNDKTYNLNVVADKNDESSIKVAGKTGDDAYYGVWNKLEVSNGQTTAVDLLSKQMIKKTDAYAKTNKDRNTYADYVEALLYNFSNGSTSYSASLGKYNYLMLRFHTASIDDIIDNYYRVQFASINLLVDYSSDSVLDFVYDYASLAYDNYFSMTGKRLVVYLDCDDNGKADEIPSDGSSYDYLKWTDTPYLDIDLNGDKNPDNVTYEEIAKQLIYDVYNELSASANTHVDTITTIVDEINKSARVEFDSNPILSENKWAKYRRVGLNVKLEDYTITNTSKDCDFALKQRLYDYSRGYSTDASGDKTSSYQYFIGDSTPSEYIEPLTANCVLADDSQIVLTKDGYNLIIVTEGTNQPSAKWSSTDNDDNLFENLVIKYNDNAIIIPDIYNDGENDVYKLTKNQIKVYLLENVTLGTSNLLPSDLSSALSTFLAPVVTRFTGDATQLEIILEYIKEVNGSYTFNVDSSDTVDHNAIFDQIREINKNKADDYLYIFEELDTTGTCNNFPQWWTKLATVRKGK
jgi:hypothetical protein